MVIFGAVFAVARVGATCASDPPPGSFSAVMLQRFSFFVLFLFFAI